MDPESIARMITEDPDITQLQEILQQIREKASAYGIDLPDHPMEWTHHDHSYYDDETAYIRRGIDEQQVFVELAHEFGHVLYNRLTNEEKEAWFNSVNAIHDGVFNPPHSSEVFAKTFEHIMADNIETPHYEERKELLLKYV
jgi:hypothetical protein